MAEDQRRFISDTAVLQYLLQLCTIVLAMVAKFHWADKYLSTEDLKRAKKQRRFSLLPFSAVAFVPKLTLVKKYKAEVRRKLQYTAKKQSGFV